MDALLETTPLVTTKSALSIAEKNLSIVGYDKPELLYAAIRKHHEFISGHRLPLIARFGGASALTLAQDDILRDEYSTAAYRFAYGSARAGVQDSREQQYQIDCIESFLGPEIINSDAPTIFRAIISMREEHIFSLASAFGISMAHVHNLEGRDMTIMRTFIPAIQKLRQLKSGNQTARAEHARRSDAMREADAANRIHLLRTKVIAALSSHYHATELTRRALQASGFLPVEPANVEGFSVTTLQGILDYLTVDQLLRDAITTSALQGIGGSSPPRIRTICNDPDAETAAILRSTKGVEYTGDRFEKMMCLIPLGTAMVKMVLVYFQPSLNTEIVDKVESLKTLTFMDARQRLSLAAGYLRLSQLLSFVSRSGMSFNVLTVYRHIARAMNDSVDSARDSGAWRELCYETMKSYSVNLVNTVMARSVLDDTMSLLRELMDKEADHRGLESVCGQAVAKPNLIANLNHGASDYKLTTHGHQTFEEPSDMGVQCHSYGYDGDDDEFSAEDIELTVSSIGARMAAKSCPCGASMRVQTDYCNQCSAFLAGTQICTLCRAPRQFKGGAEIKRCRNYGSAIACESNTFADPTEDDRRRAIRAHKQREEMAGRSGMQKPNNLLGTRQSYRPSHQAVVASFAEPLISGIHGDLINQPNQKPASATPRGKGGAKGQGKGSAGGSRAIMGGGAPSAQAPPLVSTPATVSAPSAQAPPLVSTPVTVSAPQQPANEPKRKNFMVAASDALEHQVVPRIYNKHGFDITGSRGPGMPVVTATPALMEAPFVFSIDGLTERGRDSYGSVPEFPTPGQRAELDRLQDIACQQQVSRVSAISVTMSQSSQFSITMHVVPAQDVHILAVCDLEKVGMTFNMVKDKNGDNQSWLALKEGGGVALSRKAGLFYLHAYETPGEGVIIGSGGDIRFLIDTGAQASLVAGSGISLLTKFTPPAITMSAAGGHSLAITHTGELLMRYRPGLTSIFQNGDSGGAAYPPSMFIGEVRASGGVDDSLIPCPVRRGRYAHIADVNSLHYRFGFTDPAVFKAIQGMASGVQPMRVPAADRFVSTTMALAASRRRLIRHVSIPTGIAAPVRSGEKASVDFTRHFEPDMDGHVAALIFMDHESREIFSYPAEDKTGESFVAGLRAYREHARSTKPGIELLQLVADCDVSWTTLSRGGELRPTEVVRSYLESSPRSLSFTRSPPFTQALNPVEGACTRLYYLMNFFLHLAMLNMVAWYDMMRAAVYAFNMTPHLRSTRLDLRSKTPYEISRGAPPDLSLQVAHPGQMVAILSHGTKSSAGADRSILGYYICPSSMLAGSGWLCREYKSRILRESGHLYVMPPFKGSSAPERSVATGGILTSDLAPRSVALHHALDSDLFRGGHGIMTPDAEVCVSQARALFRASGAGDGGDCVLWFDGVTGLPRRMVVVAVPDDVGGSLGLADEDAITMASATGAIIPPSGPASAALAIDEARAPAPQSVLPQNAPQWIKSLPGNTPIVYEQGSKAPGSKAGARYLAYKGSKTLDEYRRVQTKEFAWKDFKYDLEHNIVSLQPDVWASRLQVARVGAFVAPAVRVLTAVAVPQPISPAQATEPDTKSTAATSCGDMTEAWAQQACNLIDEEH